MLLVARHVHQVFFLFHRSPETDITIDPLLHTVFVELLTGVVIVEDLWHILMWDVCMRDEVVDGTALNNRWITMALNGFFDSVDVHMLSFDSAWGKVVLGSLELVLEILCETC